MKKNIMLIFLIIALFVMAGCKKGLPETPVVEEPVVKEATTDAGESEALNEDVNAEETEDINFDDIAF